MFRRILVPVDGSATAGKALVQALGIAALKGGEVRLVHVLEGPALPAGSEHGERLRAELRQEGARVLQRALEIADAAEVPAQTRLLENPDDRRLGDVVADEARQWGADLVVVGTHGRRGVQRALLGSGAEQVIRLAPVPVLAVRGEAGA